MPIELSADLALWIFPLLLLAGTAAGFVDTLAGGGGMITLPSLLLAGLSPEAALATNKLQGCFGTISASRYFILQGQLPIRRCIVPVLVCALGAMLGTTALQFFSAQRLSRIIPVLLLLIACLFIFMPQLGQQQKNARLPPWYFTGAVLLPIAFYDGFLGPGTGSFFLLSLITLRGNTLQQATIKAKLYNAATNLVSLLVFLLSGKILWAAGLTMAAGQILGAQIAAKLVLSKGYALIRPMIIGVSVLMSFYLILRQYI